LDSLDADAATSQYALAVGTAGERRLRAINELLAPTTRRLLEAAGIQRGMRVADIGCGVGVVSVMLGELVGPEGEVVGVDLSPAQVEQSRSLAASRGLPNCRFVEASAMATGLPSGSFDLVYGRLLLIHLPDPVGALREMSRLLTDNGVLAYEDCEVATAGSEPDSALGQFALLLSALGPRIGTDWNLGRRLVHLVKQAGLHLQDVAIIQRALAHGDHRRILEWTIAEAGPASVKTGLLSTAALNQTLLDMQAAGEDEHVLVFMPRMLQVIGAKR
jgi:SAM-dependent methyltransferase